MNYISTRTAMGTTAPSLSFEDVLLSGLAPDGGLYLPQTWPQIDKSQWAHLSDLSYAELACEILYPYIGDFLKKDEFLIILKECYQNFNHQAVAPLVQLDHHLWLLELFHGPTFAFKDYALQLLARLMEVALARRGQRLTIVGATSGDTGSAAIEAMKGRENIDIFILHPKGKVSDVQRRQMTTLQARNIHNIAIEGSFDDCQDLVKALFNDAPFRQEQQLGAVNSINWARIMAQIVYYASSSLALSRQNQLVSYAVPSGNFGNILAAWIAKKMGLPIGELIIGSNRNDILTRFFNQNDMRISQVEPSLAPSMDIQISSNFERYLFELLGRDSQSCAELMTDFRKTGCLNIKDTHWQEASKEFKAHAINDQEIAKAIAECYAQTGEVIEPHTATGYVASKLLGKDSHSPMVIAATAHPCKFPDAVKDALKTFPDYMEKTLAPAAIRALFDLEEKYDSLPNNVEMLKSYIREHK